MPDSWLVVNAKVGDIYQCESEKYVRFETQGEYTSEAQEAFLNRAKNNSLATRGDFKY